MLGRRIYFPRESPFESVFPVLEAEGPVVNSFYACSETHLSVNVKLR